MPASPPRPRPLSDPFERVRSTGFALAAVMGVRAALPLITLSVSALFGPATPTGIAPTSDGALVAETIVLNLAGSMSLLLGVGLLLWLHQLFTALRTIGCATRTSPRLAVAGWLIPVANLVLPALTMREAVAKSGGHAWLALVWWLVCLVHVPLSLYDLVVRELRLDDELVALMDGRVFDRLQQIHADLGWLHLASETLTWGLLGYLVARASWAHRRWET